MANICGARMTAGRGGRMLRNLVNAYAQRGDKRTVMQTAKYFEIWTDHHAG